MKEKEMAGVVQQCGVERTEEVHAGILKITVGRGGGVIWSASKTLGQSLIRK